jgi:hypothetical protein
MRASIKIVLGLLVAVAFTNLVLAQSEVEYEVGKFLGARSKPSRPKYQPTANSDSDYEDYDTYVLSIQWGSK